jgi:hypothetical protein
MAPVLEIFEATVYSINLACYVYWVLIVICHLVMTSEYSPGNV